MDFDLAKHVFPPGAGEVLITQPPTAGTVTILVDPQNSGTTKFCTLIQTLDPGATVPVHRHDTAEQVLFFLSGHGKAVIAGREVDVHPGTTVHLPRQISHGFTNTGDEPLSVLETTSPPGFENAFRELSRLSPPEQSTQDAVVKILAKHDILVANDEPE